MDIKNINQLKFMGLVAVEINDIGAKFWNARAERNYYTIYSQFNGTPRTEFLEQMKFSF